MSNIEVESKFERDDSLIFLERKMERSEKQEPEVGERNWVDKQHGVW